MAIYYVEVATYKLTSRNLTKHGFMDRQDLILIAMQGHHKFTPVQVQKLFFLLDQNIGRKIGGPFFDFQPYDYGPFDKGLYKELIGLKESGLLTINTEHDSTRRSYQLTDLGQARARMLNKSLSKPILNYVLELSEFVRKLSFVQLVSAIYKAYPEMKANSIFAQ